MSEIAVWVEHLQRADCLELLASRPVGRLGVVVDDAPEIYPVNHVVDGETILFRTSAGSKLAALEQHDSVCFEADGFDEEHEMGWSVLIKGRAAEVVDPLEQEQALLLPLRLWEFGDKSTLVRITPNEITGRRIWRQDAPT